MISSTAWEASWTMTNKRKLPPAAKDEVRLSNCVTIAKYLEMERVQDRKNIAAFVGARFQERYLLPVMGGSGASGSGKKNKSGFAMMAISCLMIEALESFRRGLKNTRREKGKDIFEDFFNRYDEFSDLRGYGGEFYTHIRCGILHQAETTGGWLIQRDQPFLIDKDHKIINATAFIKNLEKCLDKYCDELDTQGWEDQIWKNFRDKMESIIDNCKRPGS